MAERMIFKTPNEAITYLESCDYLETLKKLPMDVIQMIGQLQNYNNMECGDENTKKVIAAIAQMPPTSKELIAWRCGDMRSSSRGFVSATLWEDVAKKFQDYNRFSKVHPIIIHVGARLLPFAPINDIRFRSFEDPELEILLDINHLVKRRGVYHYV